VPQASTPPPRARTRSRHRACAPRGCSRSACVRGEAAGSGNGGGGSSAARAWSRRAIYASRSAGVTPNGASGTSRARENPG
jgi:hypothetical protein